MMERPAHRADETSPAQSTPLAKSAEVDLAATTSACLNPTPLAQEHAYARRLEIVTDVTKRLADAGIDIRGTGGREFNIILSMSANAFMPEYFCEVLKEDYPSTSAVLESGVKPYLRNPPDVKQQQDVTRYFRTHPELREMLAECFALTTYLGHPLSWMGSPAIELRNDGLLSVGSYQIGKVDSGSGTVFIPGSGVTSLNMVKAFLDKTKCNPGSNLQILLCDNHPFVIEVATRFARYLSDSRFSFVPLSMEQVKVPSNTSHVLLSYVEAAGEAATLNTVKALSANPNTAIVAVACTAPNEFSGMTAADQSKIIGSCGFRHILGIEVPSYSTHVVKEGRSTDFLDLTEAEAHHLVMLTLSGGPPPNTRSRIDLWQSPQ